MATPLEGFVEVEVSVRVDLDEAQRVLNAEQLAAFFGGIAKVVSATKKD